MNENKNVVYILAGVAVVLVVVAGYIVYRNVTSVPDVTSTAGTGTTDTGTPSTGTVAPPAVSEPTAYDPNTATKVAAGKTPTDHLKAYHDAVVAKKWDEAYKLLPVSMQQKYGDVTSFGEQLAGYNISGYTLAEPVTSGDEMTIAATQNTAQMPITYTWTFRKQGDTWFCSDRKMGG